MKIITANLLNEFWKKAIKPIKYKADNAFPLYSTEKVDVLINEFLTINADHIELKEYYNEIDEQFDSVFSADREKVEIRATDIELKAQPKENSNYGDISKWDNASLVMSVRGMKVFDFGHNQISYIRPIGKSRSLMLKGTASLASSNNNMFLINDFGGDYAVLDSNVIAPLHRMLCGVTSTYAYIGEVDKSENGPYVGAPLTLSSFKTGITINSDKREMLTFSDRVSMGTKKGNYFIECKTIYNNNDYAYTVKLRNGKGMYLSIGNEFNDDNKVKINGDIVIVDEENVTNFDSSVTNAEKEWLLGNTLQNLLISLYKSSKQSIGALSLDGGTMHRDAKINMIGSTTYIYMQNPGFSNSKLDTNRINFYTNYYDFLIFVGPVDGSICKIEVKDKSNDNKISRIRFYNGRIFCEPYDQFVIDLQVGNSLKKYTFDDVGFWAFSSEANLGTSAFKWNDIYATNGTIQTSDKTKKININNLDIELTKKFIMGLIPSSYSMIDGTSGRTHWGLIAQYVEELMEQLGMTSKDFAGFIKSPKKVIKYEEYGEDENGEKLKNSVEEIVEGEYDYGLRYEEFIAPIISVVQEHEEKIQEQQKTIDKQQETINKQQKEIEELKKEMEELKQFILK